MRKFVVSNIWFKEILSCYINLVLLFSKLQYKSTSYYLYTSSSCSWNTQNNIHIAKFPNLSFIFGASEIVWDILTQCNHYVFKHLMKWKLCKWDFGIKIIRETSSPIVSTNIMRYATVDKQQIHSWLFCEIRQKINYVAHFDIVSN